MGDDGVSMLADLSRRGDFLHEFSRIDMNFFNSENNENSKKGEN